MNDLVTFEIKTPTIIFEGDFSNDLVTFEIKMPKVSFNILPTPTLEFDIQVSFVDGVGKTYTGPYEVIPQLYEDISLPTKGTFLFLTIFCVFCHIILIYFYKNDLINNMINC